MFKQASRLKLRFQTAKGNLSVEQLWDLSLKDLDSLAVSLHDQKEASGKKSFLTVKSKEDTALDLMFNVVKEILDTRVAEDAVAKAAVETKRHNDKINSIIARKIEADLENMSVEDLEKLIK